MGHILCLGQLQHIDEQKGGLEFACQLQQFALQLGAAEGIGIEVDIPAPLVLLPEQQVLGQTADIQIQILLESQMLDYFQQGAWPLVVFEAQQDLVAVERAIAGQNGLGHKPQIGMVQDAG